MSTEPTQTAARGERTDPMPDAKSEAIEAAPIGSSTVPAADDASSHAAVDATATAEPAAAAPAVTERRFRTVGLAVARRLTRIAVALGLFAAGIAIGFQVYTTNQPPAPAAPDPRVVTAEVPLLVAELASAIRADDTDTIQSILSPEIFAAYTAEITENEIGSVEAVEVGGSWVDGPRSASSLVLLARNLEGNLVAMNLIVVTDNGPIVSLR